jgi:hypothetical protein
MVGGCGRVLEKMGIVIALAVSKLHNVSVPLAKD